MLDISRDTFKCGSYPGSTCQTEDKDSFNSLTCNHGRIKRLAVEFIKIHICMWPQYEVE